jgi:hypothetical protein
MTALATGDGPKVFLASLLHRKRLERAMKPIAKVLLRRILMTLGAIVVWAKALGGARADEQTRSTEIDQKTAGGRQQKPNREP